MNIESFNFTQDQLMEITRLFKYFYSCNHEPRSNSKVDGIQTFIDKNNDFFCSYCLHEIADNGGIKINCIYIEIDKMGKKVYLNELYDNPATLGLRFAKMQEIKIG